MTSISVTCVFFLLKSQHFSLRTRLG